jgi:hypothetical protein
MKDVTRGMTNRECRDVVRAAIKAGCTATITSGGHLHIVTPNGQSYFAGMTTSDRQAHVIMRRALIRMGVDL